MLLEAAAALTATTTTTDTDNNTNTTSSNTDRTVALELLAGAFETIRGVHDASWNELGYWFQTPEAWEASGNYRSLGYMRPLSIWGLQWALEQEPELLREAAAAGVADTEHT
jgi:Glycosyl-hydrolase family 116, catalytic region